MLAVSVNDFLSKSGLPARSASVLVLNGSSVDASPVSVVGFSCVWCWRGNLCQLSACLVAIRHLGSKVYRLELLIRKVRHNGHAENRGSITVSFFRVTQVNLNQ